MNKRTSGAHERHPYAYTGPDRMRFAPLSLHPQHLSTSSYVPLGGDNERNFREVFWKKMNLGGERGREVRRVDPGLQNLLRAVAKLVLFFFLFKWSIRYFGNL